MILYGRNPVREALRGRRARSICDVWATAGAAREPWLEGVHVRVCAPEEIERRCGSSAHQGICAKAGPYPYADAERLLAGDAPLIVVLDQVQDPQNLGSICRTAECAGASGVVIGERRSAEVTPAVCKASAGAVEHIPIAQVRNIADFLAQARQAGCWCYGASAPTAAREPSGRVPAAAEGARPAGQLADAPSAAESARPEGPPMVERTRPKAPAAVPYTAPDYRGGVVLVLGSEGRGLRPRVAGECDQLIWLPLRGRIDSLGVAAAAAALLYGILQDRNPSA